MKQEPFVELLAPAGNKEGFYGAIQAGADAVYLGGNRFNARAYADNFSTEELQECIRYAHLWKRKVYLTLNTLIKEEEFAEIYDYIKPFYEAGLDGVIVQDIGVLSFVRRNFPELELHASTQMTLTGVSGAALLKRMGVCRIVPARELSLEEICHIKKETGLAVETFIHGAMCYSYSGQCLFSSMLGGRSGNRGRCAQPCRLPYQIDTADSRTKECFPLSLKDICTIEHIPKFIEAGIDSFKIEGRMKKPEYVAGVTAIYRKYIDLYYQLVKEGHKNLLQEWQIDKKDLETLTSLYIRSDTQDGYYFRHNGREMITYDNSAYGATDEVLLAEIRDKYLAKRSSMSILVKGIFLAGSPAQLTLTVNEEEFDSIQVTVTGDEVQKAQKQPITIQNIERQLSKLGDSIFSAAKMEIQADADAFYPLGAINELRRQAIRQLENLMIVTNGLPVERRTEEKLFKSEVEKLTFKEEKDYFKANHEVKNQTYKGFVLSVRTIEQLSAVAEFVEKAALMQKTFPVCRIYIEGDMLFTEQQETLRLCRHLKDNIKQSVEIDVSLPYIIRKRDDDYLEKLFSVLEQNKGFLSGVQVRSLDGIGLLEKISGRIYGDAGFYIWNRETINVWKSFLSGFCMPLELTGREQVNLLKENTLTCEKVIYGRIPMMITANCVAKTASQCNLGSQRSGEVEAKAGAKLIDRYRKVFPVELNCIHCMNIIYNSVPLSLHGELAKWKDKVLFRLNFTLEGKKETMEILDFFEAIRQVDFAKNAKESPFSEYTTGHERHGAE